MFRRLSLFQKIIFILNMIVALLLLAACFVPHISAERFAFLSLLSLAVPFLVGANMLFFIFWVIKRKRQAFLSLFVLIVGYASLGTFVNFSFGSDTVNDSNLKIMTYNVRVFNRYKALDNDHVFEDIKELVDQEQPDIICFQEVDAERQKEYENYPYRFIHYINNRDKTILGIFSKYPIIEQKLIDFPDSHNDGAYADILYKNDTIRIYNVHLQSLGITHTRPESVLDTDRSQRIFKKLTKAFGKQQQQARIISEHMQSNDYPQILCGDFNNTQFSNTYKTVKGLKQDTFMEKGSGYGRTLNFRKFPVRIDFILADPIFEVKSHKNYDVKYSDHYPVMASMRLKSN